MFSTWSNSWPRSREHRSKEWGAAGEPKGSRETPLALSPGSVSRRRASTCHFGKIRRTWQCSLGNDIIPWVLQLGDTPGLLSPSPASSAILGAPRGGVHTLCCLGKVNRELPGKMVILSLFSWMGRCRDRQQEGFRALSCDYCWGLGVRVLHNHSWHTGQQNVLSKETGWSFCLMFACLLVLFYFLLESRNRMSYLARITWELTFRGPEINCVGFWWRHSTNTSWTFPSARPCMGTATVFLVLSTATKMRHKLWSWSKWLGWITSLLLACRPASSHINE